MDNPTSTELRATAHHEAGHCVAGILCGRAIRYVTIVPRKRKDPHGNIMSGRTVFRHPKAAQSTEETLAEISGALMVCYAGVICEAAFKGKLVELSSGAGDHKAAVDLVVALRGNDTDPAILQGVLHDVYGQTQKLFKSPKSVRAVKGIADALMARRTLTGGEVKRIFWQAFDGKG
jgi:ATP-dependent Zn protease